jgi:hypothetical protein
MKTGGGVVECFDLTSRSSTHVFSRQETLNAIDAVSLPALLERPQPPEVLVEMEGDTARG